MRRVFFASLASIVAIVASPTVGSATVLSSMLVAQSAAGPTMSFERFVRDLRPEQLLDILRIDDTSGVKASNPFSFLPSTGFECSAGASRGCRLEPSPEGQFSAPEWTEAAAGRSGWSHFLYSRYFPLAAMCLTSYELNRRIPRPPRV